MEWGLPPDGDREVAGWTVHAPGLALVGNASARDAEPNRPIK
ncbi:hypothetical protein ACFLWG_04635 [Chloroflexota bacterium]